MKNTIAKASISGSTMHDIAKMMNESFKSVFGNQVEIKLEPTNQFQGTLNLNTTDEGNHKKYFDHFKRFSSHADITINYKP